MDRFSGASSGSLMPVGLLLPPPLTLLIFAAAAASEETIEAAEEEDPLPPFALRFRPAHSLTWSADMASFPPFPLEYTPFELIVGGSLMTSIRSLTELPPPLPPEPGPMPPLLPSW
uniref:Putative secreted protein n=1 Tax=Anopheles darlingi TaxID=43151 RepID=A0A2M4D4X9_ANODA